MGRGPAPGVLSNPDRTSECGYYWRRTIRDELADLQVPTHFLWGASDAFESAESGRQAAALAPGATFTVIEDAGHLPFLDQPKAIAMGVGSLLLPDTPVLEAGSQTL